MVVPRLLIGVTASTVATAAVLVYVVRQSGRPVRPDPVTGDVDLRYPDVYAVIGWAALVAFPLVVATVAVWSPPPPGDR